VALTPDEIEGREFRVVDHGYDPVQVDTFLTEVAASYRYAVHNLLPGASGVGSATGRHPAAVSNAEALTKVGQEVADILRSAEKVAETVRAEAEADANSIRARTDLEVAELRQAAEQDRDHAKRLLTHAQQQAESIMAEAEQQAQLVAEQMTSDASQRADEMISRSRRHAEQILRAERAVIERLQEVRSDVDGAIDRLAGSEDRPVLDLTSGEAVLRVGDEAPAPAAGSGPEPGDPVVEMMRAAVRRAAGAGAGGSDPAAPDDTSDNGVEAAHGQAAS
jgi:DivIVA domain-containing protein